MMYPFWPGRPSVTSSDGRPQHGPRPGGAAALAAAVGLSLSAAGVLALLSGGPPNRVAVDIGVLPGTPSTTGQPSARSDMAAIPPVPPPVRLRIPRINVDSVLTDLQIQDDGHLAVPTDPDRPGWWSRGPSPGSPGAAVIVGHVDSRTGPAVFYGLSILRPGDTIAVDAAGGGTTEFTVQALRSYAKDDFPDNLVYAPTPTPTLRLITCGGSYDHQRHEYLDNLVVYAEPTARRAPATDLSSPNPGSAP